MNVIKRTVSGVLGGGAVFAILYAGSRFDIEWIVGILILIVAYPAGIEYLQLMKKIGIPVAQPEFLIWIPLLVFGYVVLGGRYGDVVLFLAISYQVLRYLGELPHRTGFMQAIAGVFGLLYIPWLLSFFYLIYSNLGVSYTLVLLLMVWGYDTGAYALGSLIGRHQAFPYVSPGKSWEGVAGGFVMTVIGALLGSYIALAWEPAAFWIGFPHILGLSFIVGMAVQLGDVFESKLKRAAGVKDSGTFLPGHGGTLDRIDGLLFALPVFFFYYHHILRLM